MYVCGEPYMANLRFHVYLCWGYAQYVRSYTNKQSPRSLWGEGIADRVGVNDSDSSGGGK